MRGASGIKREHERLPKERLFHETASRTTTSKLRASCHTTSASPSAGRIDDGSANVDERDIRLDMDAQRGVPPSTPHADDVARVERDPSERGRRPGRPGIVGGRSVEAKGVGSETSEAETSGGGDVGGERSWTHRPEKGRLPFRIPGAQAAVIPGFGPIRGPRR